MCGVEIYENEKPGTPVVSGRERDRGSVRSRVKRSRACARRNDREASLTDATRQRHCSVPRCADLKMRGTSDDWDKF